MKYLIWLILALPGLWELKELVDLDVYERSLTSPITKMTGKYAAWLIILALSATPLVRLTRGSAPARFLVTHRRAIGVAAFCYSVGHTYVYILERGWLVLGDSLHYSIWTGWVALLILLILAGTSNDYMVRRLGKNWKRLQRWSYAAAAVTFLHWITLHRGDLILTAVLSFIPLAILTWMRTRQNRQKVRNPGAGGR